MIGLDLRAVRRMMNVLPPRRPPGQLEREPVYKYVVVDDGGPPVGPFDAVWQAMVCADWIEQNSGAKAEMVVASLDALGIDKRGIWHGGDGR